VLGLIRGERALVKVREPMSAVFMWALVGREKKARYVV
jgi:hypothetical protein